MVFAQDLHCTEGSRVEIREKSGKNQEIMRENDFPDLADTIIFTSSYFLFV